LSGKETLYKRIRSQKQGQEKIVQTIKLEPIIVNLNKGEVLVKDRFLCLYLELIQEPPSGQSRVHPRVREALIMHLSSLTYPEVNTYRKLNRLSGELIDLINPYMGGTVKDLVIQNVVVTADEAAVQEFLALFDPANQKNAGEKKSRD
jgi:flagellar basal body-associated protein FliL